MGLSITGAAAAGGGASGPAAFLTTVLADIRKAADEPSTNAKYTDAEIVGYVSRAFSFIWNEINRRSNHPVVIPYDLSVTTDVSTYVLPPSIHRILHMEWLDSNNNVLQSVVPCTRLAPTSPNITFEGNILRFLDGPTENWTLRLHAIPSSFVELNWGSVTSITNDLTENDCEIVIPATPTVGVLDQRVNAYAGCVIRLLTAGGNGANIVQDRVIQSYDPATRTATVVPAFAAATLPAVPATYEIVPLAADDLEWAISRYVARTLTGNEGDSKRYAMLDVEYQRAIREFRLRESHFDLIQGSASRIAVVRTPSQAINSRLRRLV